MRLGLRVALTLAAGVAALLLFVVPVIYSNGEQDLGCGAPIARDLGFLQDSASDRRPSEQVAPMGPTVSQFDRICKDRSQPRVIAGTAVTALALAFLCLAIHSVSLRRRSYPRL